MARPPQTHDRPGRGHARLHLAGAGARQAGRRQDRHLCARRDRLRDDRSGGGRSKPTTCADVVRMHLSEPPPRPRTLWPEIPVARSTTCCWRCCTRSAAKRPSPAEVRATSTSCAARRRRSSGTPCRRSRCAWPRRRRDGRRSRRVRRSRRAAAGAARVRTLWLALGVASRSACGAGTLAGLIRSRRTAPAPSVDCTPLSPIGDGTVASSELPAPAHRCRRQGTLVVRVDVADARIELDGRLVAAGGRSGAAARRAPASTS